MWGTCVDKEKGLMSHLCNFLKLHTGISMILGERGRAVVRWCCHVGTREEERDKNKEKGIEKEE